MNIFPTRLLATSKGNETNTVLYVKLKHTTTIIKSLVAIGSPHAII